MQDQWEAEVAADKDRFRKWRQHDNTFRAKHDIPKDSTVWTEKARLFGVSSSKRMRSLIDACFCHQQNLAERRGEMLSRRQMATDLFCNISQSIHRQPWSRGQLPTLFTRSLVYSYEVDAVLSAGAHLRCLGWPGSDDMPAHKLSQWQLMSLAGESYSLILATIIHGAFFCNPWGTWWSRP